MTAEGKSPAAAAWPPEWPVAAETAAGVVDEFAAAAELWYLGPAETQQAAPPIEVETSISETQTKRDAAAPLRWRAAAVAAETIAAEAGKVAAAVDQERETAAAPAVAK